MTDRAPGGAFSDWIGRTDSASETLTPALAERFLVTLGHAGAPRAGEEAPLGIHWCLAPVAMISARLGHDGHPARGEHLPPVPLQRRMWAGGRLVFHDPLRVGDEVTRVSRIAAIEMKEGRSGALCFVTVEHEWRTDRGIAIDERQDIVYREPPPPGSPAPAGRPATALGGRERVMATDPVLLFRYSAITFNGHRIHYDAPFATGVEGYPGLIVHGPLQATWLMRFAHPEGRMPAEFSFRSEQPVFCGEPVRLAAAERDGAVLLETLKEDGTIATAARAVL